MMRMLFVGGIAALDVFLGISFARYLAGGNCLKFYNVKADCSDERSLYSFCGEAIGNIAVRNLAKTRESGFYQRIESLLKKSGYTGNNAALIYLCIKYPAALVLSAVAYANSRPEWLPAISVFVLIQVVLRVVVTRARKSLNMKFQRYIYKIFKYLHNQISAGVRVTEALRTVYQVTEDKKLKNILIRLAARYELTMDIDSALDEFRDNFDKGEADMLCVALKQGIETGDNRDLLARQEEQMFKKYFNYIQAETDNCRNRTLAAVIMFTFIEVVMILIPMINDLTKAAGSIFVN